MPCPSVKTSILQQLLLVPPGGTVDGGPNPFLHRDEFTKMLNMANMALEIELSMSTPAESLPRDDEILELAGLALTSFPASAEPPMSDIQDANDKAGISSKEGLDYIDKY